MPKSIPKPSSVHRPEQAVLAHLLRELRLAAGMTQSQAADAIGITQTGISDFETSDRGLELLIARDLVRVYGGDWLAFMAELEKRLNAGTTPASALIRKRPRVSGKSKK
jgi:transcriptional regulator with XRE-family HTH domain